MKVADSIAQLVRESPKQDSNYVKLLLAYYKEIIRKTPDSALIRSDQAYEISKNIGYKTGEIKALNAMGVCNWHLNNPEKTVDYFKQSITLAIKYHNTGLLISVSNNLGIYYSVIGQTDSAVKYHNKSVDAASYNKENAKYIKSISDLGMAYYYQGNYLETIKCILESKKYYEKHQMNQDIALSYTRLGMVYSDLANFDKSMRYFQDALNYNKTNKDTTLRISILQNIGRLLYDLRHENDSASKYFYEAMQLANASGNKELLIPININIANIETEKKNYTEALKIYLEVAKHPVLQSRNRERAALFVNISKVYLNLSEIDKAEKYALMGLEIAMTQKFPNIEKNGWLNLGEIQAKKGNYQKAYESNVHYTTLLDSLNNQELTNKLSELVFQNSLEQKEHENLLLLKDNEIKEQIIIKQWYFIGATAIILLLGIVILLIFNSNAKNQRVLNQVLETKNNELKELNQTKDKFFSVISHDLRMPFNGFLGLTKLLVEEMPLLKRDEIVKIANSMLISATNIFQLLEELLDWARLQNEKITPQLSKQNTLQLCNNSLRSIAYLANKKNIEINNFIPNELFVHCDENMIKTVIRNIVSNAIKFTESGGKINIETQISNKNLIQFSISDTGLGMSPHTIDNLFRLDIKTSRKGTENETGTGLGLIICKEIILKHDGEIWAESTEGKGSTFHFTIPYKSENV
jgi:signal transduction histidine kinase/Tfp pilus assembly protein PilF